MQKILILSEMKALILAGGFATRLWPLTEKRAKPLLLLNGKTILAHILDKIPENIETYLLTNSAFEADFKKELEVRKRKNVHIFCEDAHSDGEKLGALRAISVALKECKIKENVLIFAGDNVLPELDIKDLVCSKDEARIAVRQVADLHEAQKFGVVELQKEKVIGFEEKPSRPKSTLVSTGFMSFGKNILPILHEYAQKSPDALGGIFPELLAQKKTVLATQVGGEWFDVGSFETYLSAHKALQSEPLRTGRNGDHWNNKYSGKVYLGDNTVVKNCRLSDVIVYPGAKLENCHISQCVIDENCDLHNLDLNQKLVRRGTKV
jgi:glucose-1-phosphate thymidylyltransferase